MARLFVGELSIRCRRMSRGVLYYQKYDCFLKAYSGWQHTKHPKTKHCCSAVRKPPIISGLSLQRTGNSGSVLMSSCHDAGIVLTWFGSLVWLGPALGWHSKRWYWVWSYDWTCYKRKSHIAYGYQFVQHVNANLLPSLAKLLVGIRNLSLGPFSPDSMANHKETKFRLKV